RMNASAQHLENGVHDLGGDGGFGSLGFDWRVTPKINVQGDFEYYDKHVPEQAGISLLPAVNGVGPLTKAPDPQNNLHRPWNEYPARTENRQGRLDWNFADDWKFLAQGGQSVSHRNRGTVRIGSYNYHTGANGVVTVQPVTNDYQNTFYRTE